MAVTYATATKTAVATTVGSGGLKRIKEAELLIRVVQG